MRLLVGQLWQVLRHMSPCINRLLWEGSTLDLKSIKINEGLQIITEAVKFWSPNQAIRNQKLALERLDWRWRFAEIAVVLNESPVLLGQEIKILEQKLNSEKIDLLNSYFLILIHFSIINFKFTFHSAPN